MPVERNDPMPTRLKKSFSYHLDVKVLKNIPYIIQHILRPLPVDVSGLTIPDSELLNQEVEIYVNKKLVSVANKFATITGSDSEKAQRNMELLSTTAPPIFWAYTAQFKYLNDAVETPIIQSFITNSITILSQTTTLRDFILGLPKNDYQFKYLIEYISLISRVFFFHYKINQNPIEAAPIKDLMRTLPAILGMLDYNILYSYDLQMHTLQQFGLYYERRNRKETIFLKKIKLIYKKKTYFK